MSEKNVVTTPEESTTQSKSGKKIVVIGGSGLIGSKVVKILTEHGHQAVAASPNSGVNTLTGEGLAEVLIGASVVVDVSNSPSFEDSAVLNFFKTSTKNILDHEATAGVRHHVALSIVGTDSWPENGYFRAKIAQEKLIKESSVPYSIVRATRFFKKCYRVDRGLSHHRQQGQAGSCTFSAHGRGRCRQCSGQGRRRYAFKLDGQHCWARTIPIQTLHSTSPQGAQRSSRGRG